MYHNDILLTCEKYSRNFSYFEILNYTFKKQPSVVPSKKVFLTTSQNLQESTCVRISILIKLHASGLKPAMLL